MNNIYTFHIKSHLTITTVDIPHLINLNTQNICSIPHA